MWSKIRWGRKVDVFYLFPEDIPVFLPYPEGCDACCERQLYNLLKPAGLGSVLYFPEMRKCGTKSKWKCITLFFPAFGSGGNSDTWTKE